jgi:glycine C-acetyltransferase
LEEKLSEFYETEDTILFPSCFDANEAIFEAFLTEEDAIITDTLNHASIINGGVLLVMILRRFFNYFFF